jgi:hypothetical protein
VIFTFGYSSLEAEQGLVALLQAEVDTLIDVRSHPGSLWPQWRKEEMERWLPAAGIGYEWWPELGGWDVRHAEDEQLRARMLEHEVDIAAYSRGHFPKQIITQDLVPDPDHPTWYNRGLRDYSFFMTLPEFTNAAELLLARGEHENVAITCVEGRWWACHRSMIADWLVWAGADAIHLPNKSHVSALGNRLERYEPVILDAWATARPPAVIPELPEPVGVSAHVCCCPPA